MRTRTVVPHCSTVAILIGASTLVWACGEPPIPTTAPPGSGARPNSTLGQPQSGKSLDEEFRDLAQQVPGFGGLYYDSLGTPVVVVTDLAQAAQLQAPLTALIQRLGPPVSGLRPIQEMRLVRGQYDFAQLASWYSAFNQGATGARGLVTLTDINEVANRIDIGVRDDAARATVLAEITRLGIPASVIHVSVSPPDTLRQEIGQTLRQTVRPVPGGVQIDDGTGTCTLGFNVYKTDHTQLLRDGTFFITASHCVSPVFSYTGKAVGQPTSAAVIAHEKFDPAPVTPTQDSNCPVTATACRYSDAVLVEYVHPPVWDMRHIADIQSNTTLVITGLYPILAQWGNAPVGTPVTRIGRTTGETAGTVVQSCVNRIGANGVTLLCQARATPGILGGDSGSPTYTFISGGIAVLGINWGSSNDTTVFSQLIQTFAELKGSFGWFSACDPMC